MNVFVSYNSKDRGLAQQLATDLRELGNNVWFDQNITGGQVWWDRILEQILNCDMFLFALTPASLESTACRLEFGYAHDLRKRVLPVLLAHNVNMSLLPPALQAINYVDSRVMDRASLMALIKAFNHLPAAEPLPHPLPRPPAAPLSPLGQIRDRLDAPALTFEEQAVLLVQIKELLVNPATNLDARSLINALRGRHDLFAGIEHDIDAALRPQRITTDTMMKVSARGAVTPPPASLPEQGGVDALEGHTGPVRSACFSPDGRYVLTAGDDGTVRVWDPVDGRCLFHLSHDGHAVLSASYSPDGQSILTLAADSNLRVFDVQTHTLQRNFGWMDVTIHRVRYSPDGSRVIYSYTDDTQDAYFGLADVLLADERITLDRPCPARVTDARYGGADGTSILMALANGVVELLVRSPGGKYEPGIQLRGHRQRVTCASFSPDGGRVLTASQDGTARLWDPARGSELHKLPHQGPVWSAAFNRGGDVIVTTSDDYNVRLWDARDGTPQITLVHEGPVYDAGFSPDGRRVVTAGANGVARLWEV